MVGQTHSNITQKTEAMIRFHVGRLSATTFESKHAIFKAATVSNITLRKKNKMYPETIGRPKLKTQRRVAKEFHCHLRFWW